VLGVPCEIVGYRRPENKRRNQATYRARNREKLRQDALRRRKLLKEQALDRYGRACAECGFDNPLALVIDHINNNGAEERRRYGGSQQFSGWRFYEHLKKLRWPDGYQTLCANCNLIKEQLRCAEVTFTTSEVDAQLLLFD
jgi:hypothetical protein